MLDVAGTPVAVRRKGSGRPLLFLHGAGFTGQWLRFHEALAQGADVIAPEHVGLRRHPAAGLAGRLRRPRPALRRPARDARAGRAVRPRRLLAGGWIAAAYATFYPEKLRSLTLITPGRVPAGGRQRHRPVPHVSRGALRDALQRSDEHRRGRARSGRHRRRREGLRGGVDDRAAGLGAPRRPQDAAPPAAGDDAVARRRRRARPPRARRGRRRATRRRCPTPSSCASRAPATRSSSSSRPPSRRPSSTSRSACDERDAVLPLRPDAVPVHPAGLGDRVDLGDALQRALRPEGRGAALQGVPRPGGAGREARLRRHLRQRAPPERLRDDARPERHGRRRSSRGRRASRSGSSATRCRCTTTRVRVAESVAMLDVLSEGRIISGFVRGTGMEYHSMRVNPAYSRERFWEAHDLILKAWTDDGPFAWKGKHYDIPYVNPWPQALPAAAPADLAAGDGLGGDDHGGGKRRYPFMMVFAPLVVHEAQLRDVPQRGQRGRLRGVTGAACVLRADIRRRDRRDRPRRGARALPVAVRHRA